MDDDSKWFWIFLMVTISIVAICSTIGQFASKSDEERLQKIEQRLEVLAPISTGQSVLSN